MKFSKQQLLFHLTSKLANFSKEDLEWELKNGKVVDFEVIDNKIVFCKILFLNKYLDKNNNPNKITIKNDKHGYTIQFEL